MEGSTEWSSAADGDIGSPARKKRPVIATKQRKTRCEKKKDSQLRTEKRGAAQRSKEKKEVGRMDSEKGKRKGSGTCEGKGTSYADIEEGLNKISP